MVATGVNADGYREVLGIHTATSRVRRRLARLLPRPDRPRPVRGRAGHLRRARRAGRGDRGDPAGASWQRCRTHYAANLMSVDPEVAVGLGQGAAALGLRPARRRGRARPVRPGPRGPVREAPGGRRAPRAGPRRHPRVHRLPEGDLAPDLVQQPERAAQPGDPPPHRRRRASSPTATPSSASSAPSWPSSTTNGPNSRRYLGLEALKNARAVLTDRTTDDQPEEVTTDLIAGAINA